MRPTVLQEIFSPKLPKIKRKSLIPNKNLTVEVNQENVINGLERIESFNNLLRQANTIRMNQRLNRSLEPAPGFTNHLIDRRSGS